MRKLLAITLLIIGCGGAKQPPLVPDYGPETDDKSDSATRPANTVPISFGTTVDAALGDGVNWRAFQFTGTKGLIVDAFAQGLDGTDTVLYVYKISRITHRPYGKPLAYNDDTDHDGWTLQKAPFNPYSSSVQGVTLPEDRDYALVLTTYQQAGGRALVRVNATGSVLPSTTPPFDGTAAGTPIHFVVDTTAVLDATKYLPSTAIQTAVNGSTSQLVASAAVYRADPSDLAALLADPTRRADLTYGLLLGDANTNGYDATWTPVDPSTAAAELMKIAAPDGDSGLQAVTEYVVRSMFGDAAFRAPDVQAYRLHWDNADDTNAEGIVAIKTSTGEIRVFSLDNPP